MQVPRLRIWMVVRRQVIGGVLSALVLLATWSAGVPCGSVAIASCGGLIAGTLASMLAHSKVWSVVGALSGAQAAMAWLRPLSAWTALAGVHLLAAYTAGFTAAVLIGEVVRARRLPTAAPS